MEMETPEKITKVDYFRQGLYQKISSEKISLNCKENQKVRLFYIPLAAFFFIMCIITTCEQIEIYQSKMYILNEQISYMKEKTPERFDKYNTDENDADNFETRLLKTYYARYGYLAEKDGINIFDYIYSKLNPNMSTYVSETPSFIMHSVHFLISFIGFIWIAKKIIFRKKHPLLYIDRVLKCFYLWDGKSVYINDNLSLRSYRELSRIILFTYNNDEKKEYIFNPAVHLFSFLNIDNPKAETQFYEQINAYLQSGLDSFATGKMPGKIASYLTPRLPPDIAERIENIRKTMVNY
ncbi:hypothetical protein P2E04_06745 [Providencia stuartii]|uniref:hypothetical protein n=2 Tax=Providencia stuartii TaxID=588 RepID=UPI0023E15140|nr:hypothetical protein [Providencia stuartii]ELR5141052.1 hypothetical protein [Providencia stuartii]WER23561.1 hypothetical protein P2E04_06745 [Providencia stuartii]WER31772.1 hypothetical protein P2E06_06750 [Providencia stuartii]